MSPRDLHALFARSTGPCTDTRRLQPGNLFFALRGPNFNGNRFAEAALQQGALGVVVDEPLPSLETDPRVHRVPDALLALQQLAAQHRLAWGKTVVAITGSNGKTTTKELAAHVLAQRLNVHSTPGNLNNHIGLPLSLLGLKPEHEVAVLELGDNHPGEIARLAEICQPNLGLITNIGLDHLGGYSNLEANAAGKLELFDHLSRNGGTVLVNLDDPFLAELDLNRFAEAISFSSLNPRAHVFGQVHRNLPQGLQVLLHSHPKRVLESRLPGAYNLPNILAAVALGRYMGLQDDDIQRGLMAYVPTSNRSQVLQHNGQTLVLDAYNANPSSLKPALDNAAQWAAGGPWACVLGDMLELGNQSAALHTQVGLWLNEAAPSLAVLIGPEMLHAYEACRLDDRCWFADPQSARDRLPRLLGGLSLVLFKGSRAMALENLAQALLAPTDKN